MHYAIGPIERHTDEGLEFRGPPSGTVGWVDLSSLVEQDHLDPAIEGLGFFARPTSFGVGYTTLGGDGDLRDMNTDAAMLSAWQSATGYAATGDKLVDLLVDTLTAGSDPSGESFVKPLLPRLDGSLEVHLGGHSRVARRRFRHASDPHWNKVIDTRQRDFRRLHTEAQAASARLASIAARLDGRGEAVAADAIRANAARLRDQPRKVLGFWGRQHKVDEPKDVFVPPDLRDDVGRPLPPETSFVDDFNRANSTNLGADWSEDAGNFDIFSNKLRDLGTSSANDFVRATLAMSTDDHDAQVDLVTMTRLVSNVTAGPVVRMSSVAITGYALAFTEGGVTDKFRLFKFVAGTPTQIGSELNPPVSVPDTLRCKADGSVIVSFLNGVEQKSDVDTAITGNLFGAIYANRANGSDTLEADDFLLTDLLQPRLMVHPSMAGGMRG